jgi:putative flippase GtrA
MRFCGVGALGIGVQIAVITWLANAWHVDYRVATLAGVAAAIVHNFLWHRHWTWGDVRAATEGRPYTDDGRRAAGGTAATFGRFVAANGVVSLGGNAAVMIVLVGGGHVPVVPANVAAIALCGIANFWLADRLVFRGRDRTPR